MEWKIARSSVSVSCKILLRDPKYVYLNFVIIAFKKISYSGAQMLFENS